MGIEMEQRARLLEIDIFGQPVERTRVIILNVNRDIDRSGDYAAQGKRDRTKQKRQAPLHRAGWIFGFVASFPFKRIFEMQVSRAAVPRCTALIVSFTVFTGSR